MAPVFREVESHIPALLPVALQVAYRQLGDWEAARDVVQDVFTRLWENPEQLQDVNNVRAWIIRLVLNRCTDWHRFRARLRRFHQRLMGQKTQETPDSESDWFQEVLERLSRKQRMIIILVYQEDFTVQEVSEMLHLSEDTVRVHLMRARKKIREYLMKQKQ